MLDAPYTPADTAALAALPEAAPVQPPAAAPETIAPAPRPIRIPHLGHFALISALLIGGLICAVIVIFAAVNLHLFGVSRLEDMMHSMAYAVGTMAIWYAVAFAPAAAIFPLVWGKSLFAGLHWNGGIVRRRWPLLMATGAGCFVLALVARTVLHFPEHSPIEGMLSTPQAVWTMFAFAVTVAPLCEEMIFRGFLLPALSTAFDWLREKFENRPAPALLADGHPQWSLLSMMAASVITSAIFALFHFSQDGKALGPMVLIFSVSLVLCAVRLATRSLAASTLTHATYNFTLFFLMALTTRGFQHLHH
jgi:membrane protease YdiL (CAAX protease family)